MKLLRDGQAVQRSQVHYKPPASVKIFTFTFRLVHEQTFTKNKVRNNVPRDNGLHPVVTPFDQNCSSVVPLHNSADMLSTNTHTYRYTPGVSKTTHLLKIAKTTPGTEVSVCTVENTSEEISPVSHTPQTPRRHPATSAVKPDSNSPFWAGPPPVRASASSFFGCTA